MEPIWPHALGRDVTRVTCEVTRRPHCGIRQKHLLVPDTGKSAVGSVMSRSRSVVVALALGGAVLVANQPVRAQDADRALLATFCNAADIAGSTCKRARGYPSSDGRTCDVQLTGERYSGKFIAAGAPILVVSYESGCEPHATDSGGAIVFELIADKHSFKSFQPGSQTNDCIVVNDTRQDLLICITGHIGQGILESGVAQMAFTRDDGGQISVSHDFLLTAEDSVGAYGANTVTCKERSKYFGVSKLGAGPRPQTVAVKLAYADADTIRTACGKGFPKPKQRFGKLSRGEAYVPTGYEKTGNFIVDLGTRKVAPAVEVRKNAPSR